MISFIIPTYNDFKNLNNIIEAIEKCHYKKEILVVNDGSDKQRSKHIEDIVKDLNRTYLNIKIIRHKINLGKSKAMKTGILNSSFNYVCFIDADLVGLKTEDICKLVKPVIKNEFDITMSRKESGLSKIATHYGFQQNFTGERCFKKKILLENIDMFDKAKGYSIEAEMNRRFYNGKYRIAIVSWPNVANPTKTRYGLKAGLLQDTKMYKEILKYLPKRELLSQLKTVKKFPVIK